MTLRMPSGLPGRIVQVLRDFYAAELALVDSEEGEFTTTPVAVNHFHEWDKPLISDFPAVTLSLVRVRPLEVLAKGFGDRIHGMYEVDVKAHVQVESAADSGLTLQKQCFRHATAITRVLCDQKNGLETAADPTRYVQMVRLRDLTWGPTSAQGSGQQTRTATVGVDVEKVEPRG